MSVDAPVSRADLPIGLYRVGGVAAMLAAIVIRRSMAAEASLLRSMGVIHAGPAAPPVGAQEWFALLQAQPLLGLTYLNLFDVVEYALVGLLFLALFAALRRVAASSMIIATACGLAGVVVSFCTNQAISMLSLSGQFAAAGSESQRALYLAAGEALLAIDNPGVVAQGFGHHVSLFLVLLAGLLISLAMRRTGTFGKWTAWMGILANAIGLCYFLALAFAPAADLRAGVAFGALSGGMVHHECAEAVSSCSPFSADHIVRTEGIMTELVILGGGYDSKGCAGGNSYALLADGTAYLLDCGDACGARLRPNGIDPLTVRSVFITHMHYDHMAGLFGFLFGVWGWCRREEEVPLAIRDYSSFGRVAEEDLPESLIVAVPAEAAQSLAQFLPTVYLAPELWRFPLRIEPIRAGRFYEDDRISVTAHHTAHLSSQPANDILPAKYPWLAMECFGFTIEVEGLRLVYTADLALSGDASVEELRPHVQDADVIVTEVAHAPLEGLLNMLAATSARQIVLVHVHAGYRERLTTYLADHPDPRFIVAQNGMRIELG